LENSVTTALRGTCMVDRDFWSSRRVLVTGHSGFIGGWTSAWLCALGSDVSGFRCRRRPIHHFTISPA
jgi:hypothetical protein